MSEGAGFTTMAAKTAAGEIPEIGVGMLGYAFMGKSHANAYKTIPYMMYPPPAIPKLVAVAGRNEEAVALAAQRFGYAKYYTDWRQMLADDEVQLFDNGGPNNAHAEPSIAAAQAGKHVLCEKPLGRTAEESKAMLEAVQKAGVKHMVAFNYRFVPAVRQIRKLIDAGALGRIYHFRAVYLQEWIMPHYNTPMIWRLQKSEAGSGALGDLGAHIIDLGRYLVGDVKSVSAMAKTFTTQRPWADGSGMGTVDVDDGVITLAKFANGALGTFEATRFAAGRKNYNWFEVNGSKGTVVFNLESMNELLYYNCGDPADRQGFELIQATNDCHPFMGLPDGGPRYWPVAHIIGYEHTFINTVADLMNAVAEGEQTWPNFEDGCKTQAVLEACTTADASAKWEPVPPID